MEKSSKLTALFEAGAEPTHTAYKVVTEILIQDPEQLTFFAEDNVKIHLRTDSRRLARLFRLLRSSLPPPQSQKTGDIAVRTSDLLIHLLPDLHQLLAPRQVIDVLVPALEVCFVPPQPRGLRALASELSSCGTLLEYLAAEPSGSDILRQWVGLPRNLAPDVRDQAAWAERLANMVLSCIGNHGVAPAIRHWADLNALKDALRRLESKLLGEEGKKPHRPPSSLALDEESKRLLESFGLVEPASRRMVQRHIDVLSNGQTSTILRSIVDSFPCKQCIPGLGTPSRSINAEIHEEKIEDLSDLGLDVLGKAVGMWKVLLSGPALKSIQTLSRLGLFGPVQEKLTSLASGSCLASGSSNTKLAGSAEQRKQLKVPLASTKCGRNLFVLWQVSVGVAGERQAPQQVIIVWEVGNSITISKALERAILLHRSYSKETMDRSRQRPATVSGVKHPVVFNDYGPEPARLEIPSAVLDIRTVDQGTIEMAARFYVLTRPVIRSIIANDLAAELPFDLSTDEARCVAHFQTASLILGRSGTGKTTCLVFKLVGKFLASKQVSGGKPARQVGHKHRDVVVAYG